MKWTKEEHELFVDNYGIIPLPQLAKMLNRSEGALRIYASNHNVINGRFWTKEQDQYLTKWYAVKTNEQIGKHLKRSEIAVVRRAQRLGLGRMRDYSDSMLVSEVSELMGLNDTYIMRYFKGLKVIKHKKYVFINELDLEKWLLANPDRWDATKCDKYYFEHFPWFHDKLLADREKRSIERWTTKQIKRKEIS